MFAAVIDRISALCRDMNLVQLFCRSSGDLQFAVPGRNDIVAFQRSFIECIREGVVRFAGQRSGSAQGDCHTVISGKSVAFNHDALILFVRCRQRIAVIGLFQRYRPQRDISRLDHECSRNCSYRKLLRDIIAFFIGHFSRTGHRNAAGSGMHCLHFRFQTGNCIAVIFHNICIFKQSAGGMLRAVITYSGTVCHDRQLILRSPVQHIQCSVMRFNPVVIRLCIVIQRIRKCILRAAGNGLRTGDMEGCAFAVCEAFAGNSDFIVLQRASVIFLFAVRGCQDNRSRCDLHLTVNQVDMELSADVISFRVQYSRCSADSDRICSGILPAGRCGNSAERIGRAVHLKLQCFKSAERMGLSVIGECIAAGSGIDFIQRLTVGDLQLPVYLGNRIITRRTVQTVSECILRSTGYGSGSGCFKDNRIASRKSVAGDPDTLIRFILRMQRSAVIHLCGIHGCQHQAALRDFQRAALGQNRELSGHIIALFIGDHCRSCDRHGVSAGMNRGNFRTHSAQIIPVSVNHE